MAKNVNKRALIPLNATYMDHHYMTHWLWSCERNGKIYLELSERSWRDVTASSREDIFILEQARYHFVATLGYMLRVLEVSVRVFPELAPAYENAVHIRAEGKRLRDMVEHAYGANRSYMEGDGQFQPNYEREFGPSVADATSDSIGIDGHMLGNRLCVERALEEIRELRTVAATIPIPPEDFAGGGTPPGPYPD